MSSRARGTTWLLLSAVLAGASALHAGCTESTRHGHLDSPAALDAGSDAASGPSSGLLPSDGGELPEYTKIVITPAEPLVLVEVDAKTPVTAFSARGIRADGGEDKLDGGTWSFSRPDIATFQGDNLVPTGFVGGKASVTYTFGKQSGTTKATFKLRVTTGTPPNAGILNAFNSPMEIDPAMYFVYPYDKTVFPRGLPAPVLQWMGGSADNVYRIQAKSETFEFEGWATLSPPGRYLWPTTPWDVWAKLTDSTVGDVQVSIQRYDGFKAYKPKSQVYTVAPGNLKGTIYYTRLMGDMNGGESYVRRIEPGKAAESFLEQKADTKCIACHTVSRDGSRIVASLNGGASPWATFDTKTGKELYRSSQASGFQAISPNGSHVLWRHWNGDSFKSDGKLLLSTFDNDTVLAELAPPGASPANAPSHPVWSPDGTKIAFSMRTNGDGLTFSASTLWTSDVSLSPAGFSNAKMIVAATASMPVATYPTWSPDSAWIAFTRATDSRTYGAGKGELWLASADGTTQVRLDAANGVPDANPSADASWGPSMHPVAVGGYFWVAFFTRRYYGNSFYGANRQLWMAAVDASPQSGKDPSHPAFYVTGQDMDSTNERPQFTVSPCKELGQSCQNGYDCCGGYCYADSSGKLACQQTSSGCAQEGQKCVSGGDCCSGFKCIGGFCSAPPPS